MKKLICMIIVCALILVCTACASSQSTPEKTLKEFETALNERDIDKILTFLPSETRMLYEMELAEANMLMGVLGFGNIISEDMVSAAFGIALGSEYIELEIISEKYNKDKTRVELLVVLTAGEESSVEIMKMIKISDKWYFEVEE